MISLIYQILEGVSVEDAQLELAKLGLKHIYYIEEDLTGQILIGGLASKSLKTPKLSFLTEKSNVSALNWEEQWSQFASDFRNGKAHINLSQFGKDATLLLSPGPGFGDLSHPTTHLVLELLQGKIKGQTVLDIGCGSGILSLAALLLGAKSAFGIDIDAKAIQHARKNARLNHLRARFGKTIPAKNPLFDIALMNMILSEQQIAIKTLRYDVAKQWIVSGILTEQENTYLNIVSSWGWTLVQKKEKDGWLGFVFNVPI